MNGNIKMFILQLCTLLQILIGALVIITGALCYGVTDLPVGAAPPAIADPHFPSRLHAVVWRNWELVPKERIASIVKATPKQVSDIATSMGLPPQQSVPLNIKERGYISIVRRNWHLLPYDQLLTMVDMTPEELAVRLREDDFLFIKLGNLKPKCDPVTYIEPGPTELKRAAQIRDLVQKEFGATISEPGESRFAFLKEFAKVPPTSKAATCSTTESLRFIYSYFAPFGDPLLNADLDPYPSGLLAQLQEQGVNGVWLHAVLRDLAPGGVDFPEFGKDSEIRIRNLRLLTQRCAQYGIKVFLYINEPRSMPSSFFASRPDMEGVKDGDYRSMCTSDPKVLRWVRDALTHVFREAPDLGGVFTITASENMTNCASHGRQKECPRCSKRTAASIIAEVNTAIRDGVRQSAPKARVICYDWGWNGHGDAPETITALPGGVDLMSVSEWALPLTRGGVNTTVGEYSVSAVGPGPRAMRHWKLAKERGLGAIAKVQLNNSWELSAVPWLPVEDLVAEHCVNLAKAGVDGMMLSWSLGGYPSPNLQLAQLIADTPDITADEALDRVARSRYGSDAAAAVRVAWTGFSNAFAEFPYHGQVLYNAPQQVGPANLLHAKPTGYSATMVGFPYDDLKSWCGPYSAKVWIQQFEKVSTGWEVAMTQLRTALDKCAFANLKILESDIGLAEAAGIHFASCANQASFVTARDNNDITGMTKAVDDECELAKRLYRLTKADSRIGFEASNHYYYLPLDLVEKVISCRWIADRSGN